jgi:hypothetical protein
MRDGGRSGIYMQYIDDSGHGLIIYAIQSYVNVIVNVLVLNLCSFVWVPHSESDSIVN